MHGHYGEALAYDCAVGASHWDRSRRPGPLPGPAPELFFAPDRLPQADEDWGAAGLQSRVRESLGAFGEWLSGWLGSSTEAAPRTWSGPISSWSTARSTRPSGTWPR